MELVEVLSVTAVSFFLILPIIALHEANLSSGGIGGPKLPAPQAGLMAQLAQGIVGGQMSWGLILIGLLFGVSLVMIGAPSPMLIAVGMYLPLETSSAIFVGGAMKWLADRWASHHRLSPEEKNKFDERGTLLASGFIAGEAITGILLASLFLTGVSSLIHVFTGRNELPFVASWGGWLSLIAFGIIAYVLIYLPLRPK
jgi:uncharacterized oligopeptide transporter (OPT) family protein